MVNNALSPSNLDNPFVWEKYWFNKDASEIKIEYWVVSNPDDSVIWRGLQPNNNPSFILSPDEPSRRNSFFATWITVRTHTLSSLFQDLIIPHTSRYLSSAAKIHARVLDILFCPVALAGIDLITLPFRAITLIPRIFYNYIQPKSPLIAFLEEKKVTNQIKKDLGLLKIKRIQVSGFYLPSPPADGAPKSYNWRVVNNYDSCRFVESFKKSSKEIDIECDIDDALDLNSREETKEWLTKTDIDEETIESILNHIP